MTTKTTRRNTDRAGKRLIVALDYADEPSALRMARSLRGLVRTVKIGSVLFTACGPSVVRKVRALGFDVMLDLKFHDIPNTVELSCEAAAVLGVSLLTVHGCGETIMLQAAARGARSGAHRSGNRRPEIVAVTVLTSVSHGKGGAVRALVLDRAGRALEAGCDGVVASAQEVLAIRGKFGKRIRIVCPGIRLPGHGADDQQRVATPSAALANGADYLVVGRPITGANDPRRAAQTILNDMEAV